MSKVAIIILADTATPENFGRAFKVVEDASSNDIVLLDEVNGHPSFKKLVDEGFTILTF